VYAADGAQSVQVQATDRQGNSAVSNLSFTLDRQAPVNDTIRERITLSAGAAPTVALSGSATDPLGVASVAVNGSAATLGTPDAGTVGWSTAATNLAAGSNAFSATATDKAGNASQVRGSTVSVSSNNSIAVSGGGNNSISATGGDKIAINDTGGDTISLSGDKNTVAFAATSADNSVVLTGLPAGQKNFDIVNGFTGGAQMGHDTIGFSASSGIDAHATLAGQLATTSSHLAADSVGWLIQNGSAFVYANTGTGDAVLSSLAPVMQVTGNPQLVAANFKFGVS
jgi:hypothetical protein